MWGFCSKITDKKLTLKLHHVEAQSLCFYTVKETILLLICSEIQHLSLNKIPSCRLGRSKTLFIALCTLHCSHRKITVFFLCYNEVKLYLIKIPMAILALRMQRQELLLRELFKSAFKRMKWIYIFSLVTME